MKARCQDEKVIKYDDPRIKKIDPDCYTHISTSGGSKGLVVWLLLTSDFTHHSAGDWAVVVGCDRYSRELLIRQDVQLNFEYVYTSQDFFNWHLRKDCIAPWFKADQGYFLEQVVNTMVLDMENAYIHLGAY